MCEQWGAQCMGKYGYSSVGAVVGATYPEQLEEMRKALPQYSSQFQAMEHKVAEQKALQSI